MTNRSGWAGVLACAVVAGCGGPPGGDTDGGIVDEMGCAQHTDCEECLRNLGQGGCSWCAGTSTCVPDIDRGGVCEHGWTPEVSECDEPRLAVPTALDIDCRVPDASDARCVEPRPGLLDPGSVGEGPDLDFASFLAIKGGAIDATRGRVLVAFGIEDASRVHGSGIMVVDLETGERELLTGTLEDPVLGLISAGAGPEIDGETMDVALAPDGSYVVAVSQTSSWDLVLLRVDPDTGDRTLILEDEPRRCTHGARELRLAPRLVCLGCNGWEGEARIAVGDDGTIYAPVGGQAGEYGIAELPPGGGCRVITFNDSDGELDLGTGPRFTSEIHGLAYEGTTLLATIGANGVLGRVDIASGARSIVSWAGEGVGDGDVDVAGDTVELSADGRTAITAGGENRLVMVDLPSGDRTHLVELGGPLSAGTVAAAMFHPTNEDVIVFLQPYSVALFEISTGNSVTLSY